jgi:hypothetical protein
VLPTCLLLLLLLLPVVTLVLLLVAPVQPGSALASWQTC